MASIRKEMTLRADPAKVWVAVRDLGALHTSVAPDFVTDVKLGGYERRPILTHLEVRRAIDPRTWQHHVPEELRAKVDAARLEAEAKARPFGAQEELAIVTPAFICQHLPLAELKGVLDRAEEALGIPKTGDSVTKKERPRVAETAGAVKNGPPQDELAFDFSDDGADLVPN